MLSIASPRDGMIKKKIYFEECTRICSCKKKSIEKKDKKKKSYRKA